MRAPVSPQVRLRVPAFAIYWVTTIMLLWWNITSCSTVLILLAGYPSLVLVQSAIVTGKLCVPIPCHHAAAHAACKPIHLPALDRQSCGQQ